MVGWDTFGVGCLMVLCLWVCWFAASFLLDWIVCWVVIAGDCCLYRFAGCLLFCLRRVFDELWLDCLWELWLVAMFALLVGCGMIVWC